MASRGVHFALTTEQVSKILAATNDQDLMAVIESIEEAWDKDNLAESDKAWDAIHRCLTDGSLLYDNGEFPLNHLICGGRQLHKGDEYTIALIDADQVKAVASSASIITESWFRDRYFSLLSPEQYDGDIGEDDFGYTWENFQDVRQLFVKAASQGRAVIFTVDA